MTRMMREAAFPSKPPRLNGSGPMRVAIVHYWLVGMRGGEKVIEEMCKIFPEADLFTHVAIPENLSPRLRSHSITESFIARLPGGRRHYQKYLPLMTRALEGFDLTGYDLVISSEAGPAKGVITDPDCLHVSYVHSPMRYIWDQYWAYQAQAGRLARLAMPLFAPSLRQWDMASAARVDHIIANSEFVARRISKAWGRKSTVIHPPVDVAAFAPSRMPDPAAPNSPYLFASELVSYKRPDLVVDACTRLGRPLVVIGDGPARADLERRAGPTVTFLGHVDFKTLKANYRNCRALVFPGIEDFGIVPLEVMMSGRPVIAFGKGGRPKRSLKARRVCFSTPKLSMLSPTQSKISRLTRRRSAPKLRWLGRASFPQNGFVVSLPAIWQTSRRPICRTIFDGENGRRPNALPVPRGQLL
ncbi:MAG: glycosyltransferase [Octadecabacter sp.]